MHILKIRRNIKKHQIGYLQKKFLKNNTSVLQFYLKLFYYAFKNYIYIFRNLN